ncbi:UPF0193 protein EVG1-like [Saccoglossus kowalevskii]|uniref:UPF0193 protein EVG1-like n=1 Tax=Saccoglossus kowalevskii TaxID=10224 RepID=A0ABM0GMM6_SACKO|nr:PREDICTED: UPF0193 protein EVG1-like [Saccoglossus kowalevskii]
MAQRKGAVAKGGMWQGHTVSYSKETQELLKVMMAESRLTNFQQRQINNEMRGGGNLPLRVHPTSSAEPAAPTPPRPKSKRVDARNHKPGLRSKDVIEGRMDEYKSDYRPLPTKSLGDKEKDRLSHIMAYGEDLPKMTNQRLEQILRPKTPPKEVDRFDELQAEVEERQAFLADMESLGKGKEFRPIIATEISRSIREMEIIDKQRTAELEKAIAERERQRQLSTKRENTIPLPDVIKMESEKSTLSTKSVKSDTKPSMSTVDILADFPDKS